MSGQVDGSNTYKNACFASQIHFCTGSRMVGERNILPLLLFCCVPYTVLFPQRIEAASFKAGKVNIGAAGGSLFACKQISFTQPFPGGKEVKVLASFGHAVNNSAHSNGAAIWVESEDANQFRACVYEYSDGSNKTAEFNWVAMQSAPSGAQLGTTLLDSWATGTECKRIDFPQRFQSLPTILVTPSHLVPERPQDAMAVWVENLTQSSFKICLREVKIFDGFHQNIKVNWMAFTNLRVQNFTLADSLAFTNNRSLSRSQDNFALCQNITFTDPFFAPPVVLVTPKYIYSGNSLLSGCNAVTTWVENSTKRDTKICVRNYDRISNNTIKVDFLVVGDPDPCLDVICDYHCLCKAFGPYDARCVHAENCPSYQEPICSSNGMTFDNRCLFEQEMCLLRLNYTIQHPGGCEGFPFQRGRIHMPHIPSLGYSHCEAVRFRPFVFYPDKPIQVQITVNHIDTSDMTYVHDAAVSWIEDVSYEQFTGCVMAAGYNERKSSANVSIDWIAYQGAPVGGVTGEVRMSQWWTGTTCKTVSFPSGTFSKDPSVFVTAEHHRAGLKRDAASIWLEDIGQSSVKICLRELQNYAGSHEDIYVNWLAFSSLHKPLFAEHDSIYFANSGIPPGDHNNAFCEDIHFIRVYNIAPTIFVSVNHTSTGGNQDPMHNSITAWVEYINTTGARVCLKELYESKYDPLSVSYTVLSDICHPGWSYFGGYCYFTSAACASWLTAEANCSTMSSNLVTVHNQEENVYIQHRHNGDRSWIGLNDRSVEGSFVWTNKEISSFRFWAPRQPNNWKNEDCVHTLGARHSYTWNDVPCDNCYNYTCFTDLDECTTNSHICDVNAVCQNTAGSHTCSCKAGYTGNGKTCYDLDECTTNSHICDVNAICQNTAGSHTCSCKAGYTGNGKTCYDVDECSSNAHGCDVNAVCTNTQGSHSCACKAKYTGNGTICVLVSFSAVFTNLGASGRLGPTSLGSYYSGQDHDGQVTLLSGIQQWTVPQTGDYRIEAIGAAAGYDTQSNGGIYRGRGARMKGTFHLFKSETIQILVGQEGGINSYGTTAGGGGGTFVVRGRSTPLIVAGGGGGMDYSDTRHTECDASTGTAGKTGYKSYAGGKGGHGAQTGDSDSTGGGGGGFYSSGRSSRYFGGSMGDGGEGGKGFLQGGVGGRSRYNNVDGGFGGGGGAYGNGGGGGGGGGYSGGGSGDNIQYACGGGGGSYNAGKNQQNECCYNTAGHGRVTITLT
ncbi:uncharacterized protein [Porites lutea]|uniref:uncharacterized protein n=1 Tax=Porites lutea TaxID=51062 RepID=UPI003CC51CD8